MTNLPNTLTITTQKLKYLMSILKFQPKWFLKTTNDKQKKVTAIKH